MHKHEAGTPANMPYSHNDSSTPSDTLAPGRDTRIAGTLIGLA